MGEARNKYMMGLTAGPVEKGQDPEAPSRALLVAVLDRAFTDAVGKIPKLDSQKVRREAWAWLGLDGGSPPSVEMSFRWICDTLGLDAELILSKLLFFAKNQDGFSCSRRRKKRMFSSYQNNRVRNRQKNIKKKEK